jgi:hypothetical protein
VRLVVVAILVLFAAQMAYVKLGEEPYPGLLMPRFGWAGPAQVEGIEFTDVEAEFSYADGEVRRLTLEQLLPMAPSGHRHTIARNLFASLQPVAPPRKALLGKVALPQWLFPGYAKAKASRYTPEHQRALHRWLVERAGAFHGGAPASFTVNWYMATYRAPTNGRPSQVKRALTETFKVSLHEAPATGL